METTEWINYWRLACPLKYVGKLSPFVKAAGGRLKEVKLRGKLRDKNGFYYLEIPNGIIPAFMKMISDEKIVNPKEATEPSKYIGAHISVMRSEELNGKKVKEVGEDFEFLLDKMYSVKPEGWDEVSKVYFVSVDSPELERLREKYGLSAKHKGHDFHITVAVVKVQ